MDVSVPSSFQNLLILYLFQSWENLRLATMGSYYFFSCKLEKLLFSRLGLNQKLKRNRSKNL